MFGPLTHCPERSLNSIAKSGDCLLCPKAPTEPREKMYRLCAGRTERAVPTLPRPHREEPDRQARALYPNNNSI